MITILLLTIIAGVAALILEQRLQTKLLMEIRNAHTGQVHRTGLGQSPLTDQLKK